MNHSTRPALACFLLILPVAVGCSAADPDEGSNDPSQAEIDAWNAAYDEANSGKTDSAGCSGVIVPDRNGFSKRVTLTFDDGPHLDNTPLVLDILAAHDAKGTFFVNGKNVRTEEHRALLKRMYEEGHILGNHTQNHKNLKVESSATVKSEIEKTHAILSDLQLEPAFFRFPFGSSSCATADTVRSYGYHVTGWHIDSADWCFGASTGGVGHCDTRTFKHVPDVYRDDIVGFVVSQARSTGGGVLLFHDIHAYTVSKLDAILTALEADGFKFVRTDDTSTFPLLNGAPPAPKPWIGDPCQDDTACTFSASGADGSCQTFASTDATYGFCTLPCNGYCPDQSGKAPTFCVSLDGTTGQCVSKAGSENNDCQSIPGTAATQMDRFVGSSTATPSTALVCAPQQ